MNYTYILTCADGTFYCGWTNDLDKRLKVHNQGKGAKYTKPRRPVVLSYYEAFETKQEAMSREYAIKHMSRAEKEHLIKKQVSRGQADLETAAETAYKRKEHCLTV